MYCIQILIKNEAINKNWWKQKKWEKNEEGVVKEKEEEESRREKESVLSPRKTHQIRKEVPS